VSNRRQFAIKLLFVVALGGVLSALLFCSAERIGSALGAAWFTTETPLTLSLFFLPFSVIAFHASTLSRNIIQALGIAVATTFFVIASIVVCKIPLPNGVRIAQGVLA